MDLDGIDHLVDMLLSTVGLGGEVDSFKILHRLDVVRQNLAEFDVVFACHDKQTSNHQRLGL